jgi:hypothetical protein
VAGRGEIHGKNQNGHQARSWPIGREGRSHWARARPGYSRTEGMRESQTGTGFVTINRSHPSITSNVKRTLAYPRTVLQPRPIRLPVRRNKLTPPTARTILTVTMRITGTVVLRARCRSHGSVLGLGSPPPIGGPSLLSETVQEPLS